MNNIDISQFNRLTKQSAQSFHQQKKLIAKLMRGEEVRCEVCKQHIIMKPADNTRPLHMVCAKGCTDIELDMA